MLSAQLKWMDSVHQMANYWTKMLPILSAQRVPRVFLWLLWTFPQMQIQNAISSNMTKQPDGMVIVAGDFNDTYLRTVLPKFHPHVKFP